MGIFFNIADDAVIGTDPRDLVKDEYKEYFADAESVQKIYSEICALDMIYSVARMKSGYYDQRLVLKGGMSVRNHVPLLDHRFSFDADYDPNSVAGYSFGDVDEIRTDLTRYAGLRRCDVRVDLAKNDDRLLFLELTYRDVLRRVGYTIEERPKIELCKRCRIFQAPEENEMATIMNLRLLGLEPLTIKHVGLEEQLASKLFIIGDLRRGKRNHFDAYDALRITESNRGLDWKLVRNLFAQRAEKHTVKGHVLKTKEHIRECRRQLDTMKLNANKKSGLARLVFKRDFDYDAMIERVKALYDNV